MFVFSIASQTHQCNDLESQAKTKAIHASSKAGVSGPSSKSAPLGEIQVNRLVQVKPSASSKQVVGVKAKPRADGSKQSAKRTGGAKSPAPQNVAPTKAIRLSSSVASLSSASSSTPQRSITSSPDDSSMFASSVEDYDEYSVSSSVKEAYFSAKYGSSYW